MRKVASVEYFEANAVDDLRVLFASAEFVVRHEAEQDGDEIFDADQAQVLAERLRVEEVEETAEKWLIKGDSFGHGSQLQVLKNASVSEH